MSEEAKKLYCELLAYEISKTYGIEIDQARYGVSKSAIQRLLDEDHRYVDHVPLYSWAEDVYNEMLNNQRLV